MSEPSDIDQRAGYLRALTEAAEEVFDCPREMRVRVVPGTGGTVLVVIDDTATWRRRSGTCDPAGVGGMVAGLIDDLVFDLASVAAGEVPPDYGPHAPEHERR
ncbi:hypothetical protein [Azospirillum soli]|uniref:hypothetical protein n=1 Tax=Azospirillum soli TaxID=1304799 RepID=UPI001AE3D594|nr:hypothetical protein [Azospirillum soli]MBP2315513.1 putative Rdx family selenoprotein [Azospirillum soli]